MCHSSIRALRLINQCILRYVEVQLKLKSMAISWSLPCFKTPSTGNKQTTGDRTLYIIVAVGIYSVVHVVKQSLRLQVSTNSGIYVHSDLGSSWGQGAIFLRPKECVDVPFKFMLKSSCAYLYFCNLRPIRLQGSYQVMVGFKRYSRFSKEMVKMSWADFSIRMY